MNKNFVFPINQDSNFEITSKLPKFFEKKHDSNVLKIAKQVEEIFLYMMLKSMRNSFPKDNFIRKDHENIYSDMYDQFITQEISKKGLGLAEMIEKQINLLNKNIAI
ncbi:MAG: rod-binding protein [Buchnera aphidicola (Nurudea yanoniella)]